MILATVNNSIGDKKKHFSIDELVKLFNDFNMKKVEARGDYAINTIFKEATLQEFFDFLKEYKVGLKKAKELYEYFKLKGYKSEKFEWFFSKL